MRPSSSSVCVSAPVCSASLASPALSNLNNPLLLRSFLQPFLSPTFPFSPSERMEPAALEASASPQLWHPSGRWVLMPAAVLPSKPPRMKPPPPGSRALPSQQPSQAGRMGHAAGRTRLLLGTRHLCSPAFPKQNKREREAFTSPAGASDSLSVAPWAWAEQKRAPAWGKSRHQGSRAAVVGVSSGDGVNVKVCIRATVMWGRLPELHL